MGKNTNNLFKLIKVNPHFLRFVKPKAKTSKIRILVLKSKPKTSKIQIPGFKPKLKTAKI